MKVLVTGAGGFVGRWLARELEEAGHEVVATGRGELDVTDQAAFERALEASSPDAIAHLAAVSFGPTAAADPAEALRITVGGTIALFGALRAVDPPPAVLVTGSSDVYGRPDPGLLPLDERAPLAPTSAYALTKAAQEAVALQAACRDGLRVVVTRSFNHSGAGQRPEFVVPALAQRVAAVRRGQADRVMVGNTHVRRDFTDVRDVVVAYRLLLEQLQSGALPAGGALFNVASGRSVSIGEILDMFCRLAGVDAVIERDPGLIRQGDPEEIRGDAGALRARTGWEPRISVEEMVAAVWEEASGRAS